MCIRDRLRADGVSINDIADKVGINRCSVMLCLNKFKEGGVENALFDAPGPVSYTHLDVYKRQVIHRPINHDLWAASLLQAIAYFPTTCSKRASFSPYLIVSSLQTPK